MFFATMEKFANDEKLKLSFKQVFSNGYRDVFIKFLFYSFLTLVVVVKSNSLLSSGLANVITAVLIFSVPASLMILVMEKRFFSCLNPVKIAALVGIVRTDYFVLFFLSLISALLLYFCTEIFWSSESLEFGKSVMLLFFSIQLTQLLFIAMGYSVFRNHTELNYNVRSANLRMLKDGESSAMVEVDIFVQEGRFEDAQKILINEISENERNYFAYEKLIMLYAFQSKENFARRIGNDYFSILIKQNKVNKAADYFCELCQKSLDIYPTDVAVALAMISVMNMKSQLNYAIKLIEKYSSEPNSSSEWDKISILKIKLSLAQRADLNDIKKQLVVLLRRSVDQSVLEEAQLLLDSIQE